MADAVGDPVQVTVQVTVNGDPVTLAGGTTVAALVAARSDGARRVAVACNGEVVPRSAWPTRVLAEGDAVEVLAAVAGG